MSSPKLELALCESLAIRSAQGDTRASDELIQHLWPVWLAMISSSRRMRTLARSDVDHVHNVVARLISRFDARNLGSYLTWKELNPDKSFGDWMHIVVANVERTYVAACLGPQPKGGDEISPKRLLNEATMSPLADEIGVRPPFTAEATARQVLEFARSKLAPKYFRVLERWLVGVGFEDIAADLGLSLTETQNIQRAGVAVLRRHFGQPERSDQPLRDGSRRD